MVVLGAGGAGLMCAAVAGQRGRRVCVIDHADKPGKKILISGGGRCNFTNTDTRSTCYLSANPHFAKSALERYRPSDFIAMVDAYKIAWHEKTLGQLFCDGSAKQIVGMLLTECEKGGVIVALGNAISDVSHADGKYRVTYGSTTVEAPSLVVATGGPSIPKMGATGFAYDLARKFGLKVVEPRPALVPLTLGPQEALFTSLSGVSANVEVRTGKNRFREAALFTHKGLSGPAILQISSYWHHREPIAVNFMPDRSADWLLAMKAEQSRTTVKALLATALPDRLAQTLNDRLAMDLPMERELANVPDKALRAAGDRLSSWHFHPSGTEGFAKAEVTAGGISTAGLSSRTMEAKTVPGLYAIGEAVDVTGWLGGYNFQWAWASGWAAGQVV